MINKFLVALFVILITGIFALRVTAATTPPLYHLIDLGTLGGPISIGEGINASGEIAGDSDPATGNRLGFTYSNGIMTPFGTLGGTGPTFVGGINSSGQVVGVAFTAGNSRQDAFLYSSSHVSDLNIGTGGSNALAINDSGQITGTAFVNFGGDEHAYLYSSGTSKDLGTFGGTFSIGRAINTSGQVVGNATLPGGLNRAFLYSGGSMMNLGVLGVGGESFAYGINDAGDVVGSSDINSILLSHAFLYHNGTMIDLGSLGNFNATATDINNVGQIVGSSNITNQMSHGFIYENSAMYDLNNLLDASGTGWVVDGAKGINDDGLIVGTAVFNGGSDHAILLTPVPEPSTLALLTFGAVGLLFARRCLHH